MEQVRRQYVNPKFAGAFSGASTFLKNRKFDNPEDVKQELKKLKPYYQHFPRRNMFKRQRVITLYENYLWGMDLIDLQKFSRQNRGFKYILIIIDSFTKKLQTVALKNKTGENLARVLKTVFKKSKPEYVMCDEGTEFWNKEVKLLMKKLDIKMYHNHTPVKCSFCERVIRTLMMKISRYFTHSGTKKYIDVLQLITRAYNATIHRTTGLAPKDINEENTPEVFARYHELRNKKEKAVFKAGDKVRILTEKSLFTKGYAPNWEDEEFTVTSIKSGNPPMYYVKDEAGEDVEGGYYRQELLAV